MTTRLQVLAPWLAALWWGSLTTLGVLVVPLLFVHLPSPVLAGGMAINALRKFGKRDLRNFPEYLKREQRMHEVATFHAALATDIYLRRQRSAP